MLGKAVAVLFLAQLLLLANASANLGIIIFAYHDSICDEGESDNKNGLQGGLLISDGSCTSLVQKGSSVFRISNPNKVLTSCRVQIYPTPSDSGVAPCSGHPIEVGVSGTADGNKCFAYTDYSHYTIDNCDPSYMKEQEDEEARARAHTSRTRGVIAGSVMAVLVVIIVSAMFIVLRARRKMRMAAHGKVEEIELEERERQ